MIWLLCSDAVDISSLSVALITFVVCSHVMDILMFDYSIYQSPVYLCVVHYKRILHVSFVYECVFLIDPNLADRFLFAGVPLRCIMRDVIANSAFLLISSVTLLESALLSIETSPSMSAINVCYHSKLLFLRINCSFSRADVMNYLCHCPLSHYN